MCVCWKSTKQCSSWMCRLRAACRSVGVGYIWNVELPEQINKAAALDCNRTPMWLKVVRSQKKKTQHLDKHLSPGLQPRHPPSCCALHIPPSSPSGAAASMSSARPWATISHDPDNRNPSCTETSARRPQPSHQHPGPPPRPKSQTASSEARQPSRQHRRPGNTMLSPKPLEQQIRPAKLLPDTSQTYL
jgi:hypothetical protein